MILGLSIKELLIISLFFVTSGNCALTYFCCSKSLRILDEDHCVGKAVQKLRTLDQYVLSKVNLIIALFYFWISHLFVESYIGDSNYIFFLSCLLAFPLTLITTFASRVCYCYTCNVLLETKLNEFECLVFNFKSLLGAYLPFFIISFVIPSVYWFELSEAVSIAICGGILGLILILWILISPRLMVLNFKAKEVEQNTLLRHRLEKLMNKHDIKRYKLYLWDASRSKEANAMVSGLSKCYLFISSCLIEELTLPELETVITHEIGHMKNRHLMKLMIGKGFIIITLAFLIFIPYIFSFADIERGFFYFITMLVTCAEILIGIKVERTYENQADMYAAGYNDPELFSSALKKILKYEGEENSVFDNVFQSHSDVNTRIENVTKDKK